MEAKRLLSLMKKHGLPMISALLQDELKYVFIIFSAGVVYMEMSLYLGLQDITPSDVNGFVFFCAGFALLYSVICCVLSTVSSGRVPVYGAVFAGIILSFLLRNSYFTEAGETGVSFISAGIAAGYTGLVWLVLHMTAKPGFFEIPLCVVCDVLMVFLFFKGGYTENLTVSRLAVTALFALSLSYFRDTFIRMTQREGKRYPFIFFAVLALCILPVPVRDEPIDWTPVIEAGMKVRDKSRDIVRSITYYGSEIGFGSSYRSGYSDLSGSGEAIFLSDRAELTLTTNESTLFRYTDEATGKRMKQRKAVYLAGGRAADKEQLLDIIYSLYLHGVDYADAGLFMTVSRLDETYVYLKTDDEIIPLNSLNVSNKDGKVLSGSSGKKHRKGYSLKAEYLDLDFGSPYLADIMSHPVIPDPEGSVDGKSRVVLSYDEICTYARGLLGLRLNEVMSEEDYDYWKQSSLSFGEQGDKPDTFDSSSISLLDTAGATDRMRDLALEITRNCNNTYEKCTAIEAYLRQYTYRTDIGTGTIDAGSADGMSRIADSFLFETGGGYCVHYASSMVMLLRLNGIPARYTRGYRYVFPEERQDSYTVKGNDAHAWPEAYIGGFGWVSFEPTSIWANAQARSWHRHPSNETASGSVTAMYNPYENGTGAFLNPYPTPAAQAELQVIDRRDEIVRGLSRYLRMTALLMAVVICVLAAVLLGGRLIHAIRYKRADSTGRVFMDVEDIVQLIRSKAEIKVPDRGVLSDYHSLIPDEFRDEVIDIFEVYYRLKYSSASAVLENAKATSAEETAARELLNNMKKKK